MEHRLSDNEHPAAAHEKVNILIVDDLPEKLIVYQSILEELGQNLVLAKGGDEALKMVLAHEFAVILLDVNMPGIDGFETASLIRQRRKSAHTPIIFLTAFTDEHHVSQGYASGAVDYLTTPVIPEVLRAKVRVFIELSQMRQKAAMQAEEHARRKAAEEADRRKDEFLGMLAHELRNPLGPIRNAVYLMQALGTQEPRLVQLREIINRQSIHMARLVDDLLDSTRLARGQILLRRERGNLSQLVEQAACDYKESFEADKIRLSVETPQQPVWVDCDPTRLTQMVGNLLHNAHKFTNAGGTVTLKLEVKGKTAEISVTDSGIGIDETILPFIFDVFRQAEQGLDRKKGGLGLGLPLVKGLAELHDGSVKASSNGKGNGSCFTISLPLSSTAGKPADKAAAVPACEAQHRRVLIIEDNFDTAITASQILVHEGHEVRVVHTGSEGLNAAKDFKPQVILCDIGLPEIDGYQVVRNIRNDSETSSAYIIALTGYGREEDRLAAKNAGFDMHMTKPIDYESLRRILSDLPAAKAS